MSKGKVTTADDDGVGSVESVKVGDSSTSWGVMGGGKPGCNHTYEQLQVDRNQNPSNEGHGGKS